MSICAIKGIGIATSYGLGFEKLKDGLLNNYSTIKYSNLYNKFVAEIPIKNNFKISTYSLLEYVINEALDNANLSKEKLKDKNVLAIICTRSGKVPQKLIDLTVESEWLKDKEFLIKKILNLKNIYFASISAACATVNFAINQAINLLKDQSLFDYAIILGSELLNKYEIAGMEATKALGQFPAKPFDKERAGINLGEGGGAIIIENYKGEDNAKAIIKGVSTRVSVKSPTQTDILAFSNVIKDVLKNSKTNRIDMINAHATGTIEGDSAECKALNLCELLNGVPVTSIKGAIGHLLYSAGFPSIVSSIIFMQNNIIPPTIGLENIDTECNISAVNKNPINKKIKNILINSAGFYGNYSSMILSSPV
ncbi:MAG: hypothetical protein J0H68_09550 [Sphingobacteriia bacterium]|nr:hypothetical protein [Sphingobacteriia bacterium]